MLPALQSLDEKIYQSLRLEELYRVFAANKCLFFYLIVLAFIAYGYDLFSFAMKIDSENHAVSAGEKVQWIQQGRWGMYYLNRYLLPDAIMPFIPVLIGMSGLVTGVFFYLLSLSDHRGVRDILAAPLAIACPLLAFAFYFNTLGYGLGIAFALVGGGFYALTRWSMISAIAAAFFFAVAIGIYQSALLLIPVLLGFYIVAKVISVPDVSLKTLLRHLLIFFLVLLVSYCLYEAIKFATLNIYRLPYDQEYLQGYLHFRMDKDYLLQVVPATMAAAMNYYTGSEKYYFYSMGALAGIFYLALLVTALQILIARQVWAVKLIALLALAGALSAPLMMHLLNAGDMPPRTMLGVPFVLSGLVFAAVSNNSKTLKLVLGVLVAACFIRFAVVNNRYALANQMNWKADQDLSLMIIQRIYDLWHKLPDHVPPYPVVLVGAWRPVDTPLYINRDVIGASFFYWNGGSAERMVRLWFSMRQFDFRPASPEEELPVAEHAISMPVWPAAGAVDIVNGVIVVKIAEYSPYRIDVLCGSAGAICRLRKSPVPAAD